MDILIKREIRTKNSTISKCYINGKFQCYILEDMDRGLKQTDDLSKIKAVKVYGKTAIPSGRYKLIVSYSNRFKKCLPEIINVPGFLGIRIHPGNTPADTEGCPLPGTAIGNDIVYNSRIAFNDLFNKINQVYNKEKIYITIE